MKTLLAMLCQLQLLILLIVASTSNVHAARIYFSGPLEVVEVDNGEGIFTGFEPSDVFSGFVDDETLGGKVAAGQTSFAFETSILGLPSFIVDVNVEVDEQLKAELDRFPFSANLVLGEQVDTLTIASFTPTPSGQLLSFGLRYFFQGGSLLTDVDQYELGQLPSAVDSAIFGMFGINESGGSGESYRAFGSITETSPVPLPASVWLLMMGVASIWRIQRNKV